MPAFSPNSRAFWAVFACTCAVTSACSSTSTGPAPLQVTGPAFTGDCVGAGCFGGLDGGLDVAGTSDAGSNAADASAAQDVTTLLDATSNPDAADTGAASSPDTHLSGDAAQLSDAALGSDSLATGDAVVTDSTGTDATVPDATVTDSTVTDSTVTDSTVTDTSSNDTNNNDATTKDTTKDTGPPPCPVKCAAACCQVGQACVANTCVTPAGGCATANDCNGDHGCLAGYCLPYDKLPMGNADYTCEILKPPGVFKPVQQCAWSAPPNGDKHPNHRNVLGTPIVLSAGGFSDLLDPSIVFVSYDGTDGGSPASACASGKYGVVRVIRGADCSQLHSFDSIKVRASTPLAGGDLDGDGEPEIVAIACTGGVVAWTYSDKTGQWSVLWQSTPVLKGGLWQGPSIHDLNNDGKAEVLVDGIVLDHKGKIVDQAVGQLAYSVGIFPVVADVDADGTPELVTGDLVYQWSGANKWALQHQTKQARGHVAVADFGTFGSDPSKDDRSKLDGIAEVAVVTSGQARVQTVAGRVVFGPVKLPGGGTGGPPTLGDFDKDGRVELALAGLGAYTVFDMDCLETPKIGPPQKATCPTLSKTGILWTSPSKDHSSSVTGSSIFDFEGDGKAEAIYADECFARVYDGSNGEVLYSQYHTSCTWYENPIVADVDGDFKSELVVPSNNNCNKYADCLAKLGKLPGTNLPVDPVFKGLRCKTSKDCQGGGCDAGFCRCTNDAHCGAGSSYRCGPMLQGTPGKGNVCRSVMLAAVQGVRVYKDSADRWVDSRPVWNQHAYAITNVGTGGEVPPTQACKMNWAEKGLNNFRQNAQGAMNPSAVPDFTSKVLPTKCEGGLLKLSAKACNRGTKNAQAGIKLSFWFGPAKTGALACTATTKKTLVAGKCETVSCLAKPPNAGKQLVSTLADDGGKDVECHEQNNAATMLVAGCS